MAGNTTSNQSPQIKAQVYSEFILMAINDGLLPDGLHRDVSDFANGDTLYIPSYGEAILRDYTESTDVVLDAIDTGQLTLTITEYVSSGTSVTDKLKQDAYLTAAFESYIPQAQARAIAERYETDLLSTVNEQTASDPNTINGFDHRWMANNNGTAGAIDLSDFWYAKLSLDKAEVPDQGRMAIVDPIVEATLNKLVGDQAFVSASPSGITSLAQTAFAKQHRFVVNLYGFDIFVSNRLPRVSGESISGGPSGSDSGISSGVVNILGAFTDDMVTPFMGAFRQMPTFEGDRDVIGKADVYTMTARWGFGLQRAQSLIGVITSETATS